MKYLRFGLMLLISGFLFSCQVDKDPVDYVNPFIGTGGHGHTYPGATLPFGMVQLSPDTRKDSWDGCSGYHYSDKSILGFSHTHLSGTGVGDYGDIRMMPTMGKLNLDPGNEAEGVEGYRSSFHHDSETASPGFYKVELDDYHIRAELTATERTGFHRYTFSDTGNANLITDLFEGVTSDKIIESEIRFVNDTIISGFRRTAGWARDQSVYFYAIFSKPIESQGIQLDDELYHDRKHASGTKIKAWASWSVSPGSQLLVKVGISAVDVEGAKNNVLAENTGWDFDAVKAAAKQRWSDELSRIDVIGSSANDLAVFYTALYHSMIAPNLFSDVDGRFRGHDSHIHQADNDRRYTVFSLWDTFRSLHPLLNIVQPARTGEMIRTMLDIYEHGGLLPVWELAGNETWCMIGYHSVPVIADAWRSGIRDFDASKALIAMQKSANQEHHGLKWYNQLGYIPANKESESVSKTLEYAYDDWCIADFAKAQGNESVYQEFIQRAQYYKNLYDPQTKFFRGKQNGGFIDPFDPTQVNFMLTEANTWQYNFFVPQDISGHIRLMGGDEAYEKMLDELFTSTAGLSGRDQSDITGLIGQYAHGNEPSHHMAYLYNYVGKPHKTQALVSRILNELYSNKPDGLSGNEDCGQMSAWYVMSAMGIYPVTPSSSYYAIGTPLFEQVNIYLESNKMFKIKANKLSKKNIYVQSAMLNGKPYNKSYLLKDDFFGGGELVFEMGPQPNLSWGSLQGDRPEQGIEDTHFVAVPWLQSDSKTFTTKLDLSMSHPDGAAVIRYTTNESEPDTASQIYKAPIELFQSTVVTAKAYVGGHESKAVSGEYFSIPAGRTIQLLNPFNTQYPGGGNNALIDNQHGTNDFRTGSWQGYYGDDLDVIVDLGKLQPVRNIKMGFLQDQRSWVFMPLWMHVQVSADGVNYKEAGKVFNTLPAKAEGAIIRVFAEKMNEPNIRFIRITAKNRGVCPEWHPGSGEKAWIFADEILIE